MSLSNSGDSDRRYSEICGATNNRGEECKLPAGWGTPGSGGNRCKYHGGASTGPADKSHLVENDFADGNPGGSAPKGNTNAEIHGGFSNWRKAYDRLDDPQRDYVEWKVDTEGEIVPESVDVDPERREELLRERAVLQLMEDRSWLDLLGVDDTGSGAGRGMMIEGEMEYNGETHTVEKSNPAFDAAARAMARRREIATRLGLHERE